MFGRPAAGRMGEADVDVQGRVLRAQSCALDAGEAVREFHAQVVQPDAALVIFFCSPRYDLELVGQEMRRLFADIEVIGCTTAGEFGPAGYRDHTITGASFPAGMLTVVSRGIERLQDFDSGEVRALAQGATRELQSREAQTDAGNTFAFLLVDGLSGREEALTRALQAALGAVPLVGGSAGDGLDFGATRVYFDGAFHTDSAVLAVVTTPLRFRIFKTQHFVAMDERVVVTAADADRRIIHRIDGRPAAQDYARLVGVSVDGLDPTRFAGQPMVVLIDGTSYVRSIQKVNPDGSLSLFCAIEEGIVLRAARGAHLGENLIEAFADINADIGRPQLVIGCDCVLRKLEILNDGHIGTVEKVFAENNVIGFNSYGEQFHGVHVNQTLTGIAIGEDLR